MTNSNLNTYELTPEDNARIDAEIDELRKSEDTSSPYNENTLRYEYIRTTRVNTLVNQKSTLTLTIPLNIVEYLAGSSRDLDPETYNTFKQLVQEQTGVELY